MIKQRLICYFEANKKTGIGHLKRVKSFLDFINLNRVCTIVTSSSKYFGNNFTNSKFKIIESKNIKIFFLKNLKFYSHLILDPPFYSNNIKINSGDYWNKIFNKIKFCPKILRFTDEIFPTNHMVDYLVNPVPGSEKNQVYYKNYSKKVYLGSSFFLPTIKKKIKNSFFLYDLLVCFGGSDPKNLALKYYSFLKRLDIKILIISNDYCYNILKKYNNKNIYLKRNVSQNIFFYYLKSCKFFFSTASNIMLEALNFNMAGLVVSTQSRQSLLANLCVKYKYNISYLGKYNLVSFDLILNGLKKIKQNNTLNYFQKTNKSKIKKLANEFIKKV